MTKEKALEILDLIPTIGEQVDALEMAIKALESQRPTGKWINEKDVGNGNRSVECSNCGAGDEQAWLQKVHYCWNCGAKMEVEK